MLDKFRRRWPIVLLGSLSLILIAAIVHPQTRGWMQRAFQRGLREVGYVQVDLDSPKERLIAAVGSELEFPLPEARIVIHKSQRTLELYSGEDLIKSYRVGLGGEPEGAKKKKGDRMTPEGNYFICSRLGQSRFHLFLGINFPNAADARGALDRGLIGDSEYASIVRAAGEREMPTWEGAMGGAIGIHGSGSKIDWTLGCIALDDVDVEEIWVATRYWTPVTIEP